MPHVKLDILAWWWGNILASKKQTCNTDSTMDSEFVALILASKAAEWLET